MRYIELKSLAHRDVDKAVAAAIKTVPGDADPYEIEANVRKSSAVDYKELLRVIVQGPRMGQEGMSTDDMEASSDVLDKLDKLGPDEHVLELENAEYKFLLAKVEATGWKYADPRFAQFVRDIRSAPTEG